MSTDADQPGSDAANQSKTESMPPTEGHADPDAASDPTLVESPELDGMNVGAGDPQAPGGATDIGVPGATAGPGDAAGVPVTSETPATGTSEDLPVVQGVHTP